MPFLILNACGVLDTKATPPGRIRFVHPQRVTATCTQLYGRVRFLGCDNNYYLGTLFQLNKDEDARGVRVGRGDKLLGDTLTRTLSEVTA